MKAYAYTHNGKIIVPTVHDHSRGAKVNGLLVLFNITVRDSWSDADIHHKWDEAMARLAREKPAEVVAVVQVSVIAVAPA